MMLPEITFEYSNESVERMNADDARFHELRKQGYNRYSRTDKHGEVFRFTRMPDEPGKAGKPDNDHGTITMWQE